MTSDSRAWLTDALARDAYASYVEADAFARRVASDFTYTDNEVAEARAVANKAFEKYRQLDAAEWDAAVARVAEREGDAL